MTGLWGCFGLGVLVLVVALAVIAIYNRLVVLRNRVDNAWSQIDVQLKRRYDLIPNLVETVKGYAAHETGVFEKVTQARAAAINAQGVEQQGAGREHADRRAEVAVRGRRGVSGPQGEPELPATCRTQLTDTENKIAYARQFYNDSVMSFNTAIQSFPANLLAGMFGFAAREYFEIEPAADRGAEGPVLAVACRPASQRAHDDSRRARVSRHRPDRASASGRSPCAGTGSPTWRASSARSSCHALARPSLEARTHR